jgi:hypothetical protein
MSSYVLLWVLMNSSDIKQQHTGIPIAVYTSEQACASASQKDNLASHNWGSDSWVPHPPSPDAAISFTRCQRIVLDPK